MGKAWSRRKIMDIVSAIDHVLDDNCEALKDSGVFAFPTDSAPDFGLYAKKFGVGSLARDYAMDFLDIMERKTGFSCSEDLARDLLRIRSALLTLLCGFDQDDDVLALKSIYDARLRMYDENMDECVKFAEQSIMDDLDLGDDIICGTADEE